jgi:hypothetical protein
VAAVIVPGAAPRREENEAEFLKLLAEGGAQASIDVATTSIVLIAQG